MLAHLSVSLPYSIIDWMHQSKSSAGCSYIDSIVDYAVLSMQCNEYDTVYANVICMPTGPSCPIIIVIPSYIREYTLAISLIIIIVIIRDNAV